MRYRVIIEQPSWRRWATWVGSILIVVLAAGTGAIWGLASAQDQIIENRSLHEQVQQLGSENLDLRGRVTDGELVIETQRATSVALRDELTELHKTNAELEIELGFFRKIMSPGELPEGIQIEQFGVDWVEGSQWNVQLTLIQVAERHAVVSGDVELTVIGTRDGEVERLVQKELATEDASLDYRFRYFQALAQRIVLPEGFLPKAVEVTVLGRKGVMVQSEFAWPSP